MTCNKCKTDGVKNTVLGKDFYYCRTCKIEIENEPVVGGIQYATEDDGGDMSPPHMPLSLRLFVTGASNPAYRQDVHTWVMTAHALYCKDCGMLYDSYQKTGFPACRPVRNPVP